MSPSTLRWPIRCMPTRLWKPTLGTDFANSAQLSAVAPRLKAAPTGAPGRTAMRSPTSTEIASLPFSTVSDSAASRARRCSASLPSRAAARRVNSTMLSVARLDVGVLDDLGPFGDVVGDGGARLLGRAADDIEAEVGELLLHLRIGQHLQRFGPHLVDDGPRRASRAHQRKPRGRLEAGEARFDQGRQVGRVGRAL